MCVLFPCAWSCYCTLPLTTGWHWGCSEATCDNTAATSLAAENKGSRLLFSTIAYCPRSILTYWGNWDFLGKSGANWKQAALTSWGAMCCIFRGRAFLEVQRGSNTYRCRISIFPVSRKSCMILTPLLNSVTLKKVPVGTGTEIALCCQVKEVEVLDIWPRMSTRAKTAVNSENMLCHSKLVCLV